MNCDWSELDDCKLATILEPTNKSNIKNIKKSKKKVRKNKNKFYLTLFYFYFIIIFYILWKPIIIVEVPEYA